MPGRAGRQLLPLEQDDIGPADFRQVIRNRAADHAAADNDDFRLARKFSLLRHTNVLAFRRFTTDS